MTYDNGVLTCKSREPFYSREKSGAKPNTERVIDRNELVDLAPCRTVRVVNADDDRDYFERRITSIDNITEALPQYYRASAYQRREFFVVISWEAS